MKGGIYRITRLLSNGQESNDHYVGSSGNITRRVSLHVRSLNKGKHHSPILQRAWKKYGCRRFKIIIIMNCSNDDLLINENKMMKKYRKPNSVKPYYNIVPQAGSPRGYKWTDAQRATLKAACLIAFNKPEVRAQRKKITKALMANPEHKKICVAAFRSDRCIPNRNASLKAAWARPETRERRRISMAKAMTTAYRQRISKIQLIAQNNPITNAKRSMSVKKALANPTVRAKLKITAAKQRLPERRRAMSKALRKPATLAKVRAATIQRFSDPVWKEKHRQACLQAIARKK